MEKAKPKKKEMTSSLKSAGDKKSQKEANQKNKDVNKKEMEEEEKRQKIIQKLKDLRVDYKDPYQLSEGEIMIVIEHSDDPGRVLMSTSHDYDKYKRIASKIRQWIMRDFPSMKVIIKPNNHQKDNKRIGCFEISYFHMKDGQLQREDIFSKILERKWPKWVNIQEKIKKYVKVSNLVVHIQENSQEQKKLFEGMRIQVKNVLFAKNSGSMNRSMMGSDMSMGGSTQVGEPSLTAFTIEEMSPQKKIIKILEGDKVSDASGVLKYRKLPVGNYMIVFEGNRTYKPVKQPFQVSAQEGEQEETIEVQLEDEGFFSVEVDTQAIAKKKAQHQSRIDELNQMQNKGGDEKTKIEGDIKQLGLHEKKIGNYKISLLLHDPNRNKDTPCIPIPCVKAPAAPGNTNNIFEAVIEPGDYDVVLTNGSEETTLKSKLHLTRGENRFVLDTANDNALVDQATFKKRMQQEENSGRDGEDKPMKSGTSGAAVSQGGQTKPSNTTTGASVGGTATATGKNATTAGKNRPDTTGSMVSEADDISSYNRLGSAEPKNRPGSASANQKPLEMTGHTATPARVITEDPHENDDEKFMVKMFVEQGQLPFEMQFIYEDEDDVVGIYSQQNGPKEFGSFTVENNKSVFALEDVRRREGYYRMILLRKVDVKTFNPVHVMINCNGTSIVKKISKDPFIAGADAENQCYDYAVFKCKPSINNSP